MAVAVVELLTTLTPTGVVSCGTDALLAIIVLLGVITGILLYVAFRTFSVLNRLDREVLRGGE